MRFLASSLNAAGHNGSHGSGHGSANSTARLDASGRRAHHRRSVEGCPYRIDFSRAAIGNWEAHFCQTLTALGDHRTLV